MVSIKHSSTKEQIIIFINKLAAGKYMYENDGIYGITAMLIRIISQTNEMGKKKKETKKKVLFNNNNLNET